MTRTTGPLAVLAALPLALAACGAESRPAAAARSAAPAETASVVAEVNGAAITSAELEKKAAGRLGRVRQEEYEIRRQALDELVAERLVAAEAARRGVSVDELLRREVDAKAGSLTPAEIEQIYEQNKERFGGQDRSQAIERIRQLLAQRGQAERRAAFEQELRSRAQVAVRLEAPRAKVDVPADAPSTGPEGAPVTIVEFTDYQCPFCHRAQTTIDEVLRRYPGKVRLVHMEFPLDGHPGAVPAARAARCAGEQGRFWDYHRSLMTQPGSLDDADLKGRASTLRLDGASFASCLASDRHDAAIQASLEHGAELGVTGTPAYFVNGRLISGARPIESFVEIIDAELD